ncbi:glutathione peroxidase [Histomonas meleagridis]|uniref:glutathione peroxidase n=1 Tax=Histomonas meleagridis TaxID=135588 RepID=UPI00355A1A03|nr:glutathione peroxidase [Histomonas meleagridis]KAH0798156.1 glutathione peroxidase [Histomonas meleagridis]
MSVFDFVLNDIEGNEVNLQMYRDNVLLIVNTASKGNAKIELRQLQELYEKYKDRGLTVLAFPCRQFLKQESKDHSKILHRYIDKCKVTFPIFEITKVNGRHSCALFKWLKKNAKGTFGAAIDWNFTKFIIANEGQTVKRISSVTGVKKLENEIEYALAHNKNSFEEQPNAELN